VEVAWLRNVNDYVPNGATDGSHFLDLTGYHDRPDPSGHFGGVTQTFPTVAGFDYDYHVFLDIGVFISSVSGKNLPGPISVIVGWSGPNGENPSEQTCGPFDATAEGAQWHTCELPFHARTANTTVRIYGALGKHYIGLDKVMVQCVAPLGGLFSVPIGFSDSEPPNSRWDRSRSSGHRGDLDAAGLYMRLTTARSEVKSKHIWHARANAQYPVCSREGIIRG
jgi:hypothetical protein